MRAALIEAAIQVLHKQGYGGATTAVIAEQAGASRGAILHHFGTRAQLMAEVISTVYQQESDAYDRMTADADRGNELSDWPDMLWEVLSRPSGLAVVEILQASRSDTELAQLVSPMQNRIERMSVASMQHRFGSDKANATLAGIRLFVWAIRGLSIARVLVDDPAEIERSVRYLRDMVKAAMSAGFPPGAVSPEKS